MKTAYIEYTDTLRKQVYNEFISGKSVKEIRKMFSLTAIEINDICRSEFTKKQNLIKHIKSRHPECEQVEFLELETMMCASFGHLTVGDCIINNGVITGFNNLTFNTK